MGNETFTFITSLNASNPVTATDTVTDGALQIRGVKTTLLNSFPNVDAMVNLTVPEFNLLSGVTGTTGTGELVLSNSPTIVGQLTAGSFVGSINAANVDNGILPDARIAESGVTQWQASLSITESQITDLGNYVTDGGITSSLSLENPDTTLTRKAAGTMAVEGDAVFSHESASYASAKIFIRNGIEPTTQGSDGDIFLVY